MVVFIVVFIVKMFEKPGFYDGFEQLYGAFMVCCCEFYGGLYGSFQGVFFCGVMIACLLVSLGLVFLLVVVGLRDGPTS